MIHFDNVKIYKVTEDKEYYCEKDKKHKKYSKPKITKKLMFDDDVYDLGELYMQIKNVHERSAGYHSRIEVSFKSVLEW